MGTENSKALNTESLALQAYAYFRRALMNGRYVPGEKVKLKEASDELGISQTPVREALFMLVSEQVLTQIDRRSVRVPIILQDRYREIRDLRLMMEGEAADRAAENASRSEVAGLADIHERFIAARDEQNHSVMLLENVQFHLALCEMARMPNLSRFIGNLWLQCGPMMNAFIRLPPASVRRRHPHLDVLKGLRTKDGALAKQSIQRDIILSSEWILEYLRSQHALMESQGSRKNVARRKKPTLA